VDRIEFSEIRRYLGKTQIQTAQLLGTSLKAIQSFEQGWRKVPTHIERQLLFILSRIHSANGGRKQKCWTARNCPRESKETCPAWEFKLGDLCWFINGTICHGQVQESWQKKMKTCRKCDVFKLAMPAFIAQSSR
jgi:hypothetical protein